MSTFTSACTKSPGSMSTQWPARKAPSPCILISNSSAMTHSVCTAAISPKGSCKFGMDVFPLPACQGIMAVSRVHPRSGHVHTLVKTTRSISIACKGIFVPHLTFSCWHIKDKSCRRALTCASKTLLNAPGPNMSTWRALLALSFLDF